MKRFFRFFTLLVILLILCGICEAVIKNGSIRGKSGLSYGGISYSFDRLDVVISNNTRYNVNFGGSMLFLDKNYKVIARAELMTAKIKRNSSRRYKGFFTEGTGEKAQRAHYLEWEF